VPYSRETTLHVSIPENSQKRTGLAGAHSTRRGGPRHRPKVIFRARGIGSGGRRGREKDHASGAYYKPYEEISAKCKRSAPSDPRATENREGLRLADTMLGTEWEQARSSAPST
jgi:hypothetical protein